MKYLLMCSLLAAVPAPAQFSKLKDAVKTKVNQPAPDSVSPAPAASGSKSSASPATAGDRPSVEPQPTEATVLKHGVHVWTREQHAVYTSGKPDTTTWAWTPMIEFSLKGPVPSGSQVVIDFSYPDGKPWISFSPETPELKNGAWVKLQAGGGSLPDAKNSTVTGVVPFRIQLKNELQGKDTLLFSGSTTVKKILDPVNKAGNPKHFEYYADHDWTLPVAHVLSASKSFEEAPRLVVGLWFKQRAFSGNLVGYIFKDGVEVGSTKTSESGIANNVFDIEVSDSDHKLEWHYVTFQFGTLSVYNTDPKGYPFAKSLVKASGEYEMKVLREGKLSRVLTFTVGADGQIADNELLAQNSLFGGFYRLHAVVPVKIVGDADGPFDANAWKTETYYKNPLKGLQ